MEYRDFVSLFSDPEELQVLLVACPDGVVLADSEDRVVLYTGEAEQLFGFAPFDVLGQPAGRLFAEAGEYERFRERLTAAGRLTSFEILGARRDRPPFPASLSAAQLRDRYGEVTGAIIYARDHSHLRHMEEQLRDRNRRLNSLVRQLDHVARHDQLTGMLRRGSAIDAAETARAAQGDRSPFGVALFDLDHFKAVNDTYGHAAGDEALAALATVLGGSARRQDIVGRYGGEEFVAFLPGADINAAVAFAERVRLAIGSAPVTVGDGLPIVVTVSAGVASLPECGTSLTDAMQVADERLLQAKREGRDRVVAGIQGRSAA